MGAFDHLKGTGGLAAAANPFSDQPGTPPPALTGRDPQLRLLLTTIEQVGAGRNAGELFLAGPRGLGKTSLLVEAGREASGRGIAVVRTELSRDPDDATALVLSALTDAVGRSGLDTLLDRVAGLSLGPVGLQLRGAPASAPTSLTHVLLEAARACHDDGGLLVLLDEAQEHPATAAAVVRAAHRASQDGLAFGAVLAGLPRVVKDVVAEVSYAERIPASTLGALDADDAFDAIARPLAEAGVELDDDRRPHVRTVTGGYPYFVQVLGRSLWEAADDPERITDAAWAAAVTATAKRTDQWLADRFARVPPAQQRYLHAANELGWPASTGEIAAALDSDHATQSPTRAALIDDGLLWAPGRGVVDLVIPPLGGWLDRHPPR